MPPELRDASLIALWHPGTILLVLGLAGGYLAVIGPLRQRFAGAAPVSSFQALAFLLALLVLYVAHGGPLDLLSDVFLFSAHMMQHTLFTLVMAPLFLLGMPTWLLHSLTRHRLGQRVIEELTRPITALLLFNTILSLYHLPQLYEAGLENQWVHLLEHIIITLAALLMWWPVCGPQAGTTRLSPMSQVVYLFANGVAMGPLSALLAFETRPLYPTYLHALRLYGLTPLEDQRLGALIMILMSTVAYGTAALVAFIRLAERENVAPLILPQVTNATKAD
jgi:putative membrane protein